MRVMGVDACGGRRRWIGLVLSDDQVIPYIAAHIGELVADAEREHGVDVVAIDMPIGLPDTGRRQADVLARQALGPRWMSVFMTPVREALEVDDYAAAGAVNRRLAGEGISRQAFALREKLLQVDRWVRETPHKVVECHPEVCFAELAGRIPSPKTSWAGMHQRRALLARTGIILPDDLGPAGASAGVDDVLDAAACAWTARRVAHDKARCIPEKPEVFSDGWDCAIWV